MIVITVKFCEGLWENTILTWQNLILTLQWGGEALRTKIDWCWGTSLLYLSCIPIRNISPYQGLLPSTWSVSHAQFWGAIKCHEKPSPGSASTERGTALYLSDISCCLPPLCICVTSGSHRTAVFLLPWDVADHFGSDPLQDLSIFKKNK